MEMLHRGRKKVSLEQKKASEEWHKTRVKIINLVGRKPEVNKICCICGREGKILHNKENPYFITFICDECKKDPNNIKKAESMRFDVREKLNKDALSINNFKDEEIIKTVDNYLKDYITLGEYCESINISRYQFNEMIKKYESIKPGFNIEEQVRNRFKKIQSERLKRRE